jgi:predicted small lipoprotein YifL
MKRVMLAALALPALAACGGDGPTEQAAAVAAVRVAPDERTLAVGESVQLRALVTGTDNLAVTGAAVAWSSDAAGVASVDARGVVQGVAPGTTTIRGRAGEREGSVRVSVAAAPPACDQPGAVRSLAVGEAVTLGGVAAPRWCLDGGAAGREYVMVPFNSADVGAASMAFEVQTQNTVPVGAASPSLAPSRAWLRAPGLTPDRAWETRLRERSARELAPLVPAARAARRAAGRPALALETANARVGDELRINASTEGCSAADLRTGRVAAVTQRAIVVADVDNPAGGLTDAEYREMGLAFDTLVYPVDVQHFGEPGDLDENGKVVIFYTRAVNELTPPGSGSYVAGFFFARDLFPTRGSDGLQGCQSSNYAEMFYMLAPDPAGEVNNNPRSRELVLTSSVGTLAHEFQHLINASRRLYLLETAAWNEEVWLNEGLSHVAEELVFYRAAGLQPGSNVSAATIDGSARVQQAWTRYARSNVARLESYLRSPELESAIGESGPGGRDDDLATRGAAWAFLRYAADRKGGSEPLLWRSMVDAGVAGLANVQGALGADPRLWLRDWTVSVFTDDAVANLEARHRQPSWNFRTLFNGGYPLATVRLGADDTAVLRPYGGTGGFVRFGVAPGAVGTVTLRSSNGQLPSQAFVTVVRTQ